MATIGAKQHLWGVVAQWTSKEDGSYHEVAYCDRCGKYKDNGERFIKLSSIPSEAFENANGNLDLVL